MSIRVANDAVRAAQAALVEARAQRADAERVTRIANARALRDHKADAFMRAQLAAVAPDPGEGTAEVIVVRNKPGAADPRPILWDVVVVSGNMGKSENLYAEPRRAKADAHARSLRARGRCVTVKQQGV